MNKNTVVGWLTLLAIIAAALLVGVAVATEVDQPSRGVTVQCTQYVTTVTCSALNAEDQRALERQERADVSRFYCATEYPVPAGCSKS